MRHKTRYPGIYYRFLTNGERRYEIAFTDSTGKRVHKVVDGNEKDALQARNEITGRMHRGEVVAPSKMTVDRLCDIWLDTQTGHLRASTLTTYTGSIDTHIRKRLGRKKVFELSVDDVARMVAELRSTHSAWTIKGILTPLSRMMAFAVRKGWASSNPVKGLDKSERPANYAKPMRILDRDEISLVLENAPPSTKLLFTTAIFTGLRQGELFNLGWKDVDFDRAEIQVRASKTQAGIRKVAIPDFLLREMAAKALESHGEAVFRPDGSRLKTVVRNWRDDLRIALERAGVTDRVRFHDLRHTYASIQFANKRNIVWISKQMGHANPGITLSTYANLFDGDAESKQAMRDMEEMFG